MYNNTHEKVIQLELFNVSDIPLVPIPKKKPHTNGFTCRFYNSKSTKGVI